jgi:hypothetical protein
MEARVLQSLEPNGRLKQHHWGLGQGLPGRLLSCIGVDSIDQLLP